jgi:hypothetical protein
VPILDRSTPAVSRFVAETKKDLKGDTPVELIDPEYPNTLDLRRYWKGK